MQIVQAVAQTLSDVVREGAIEFSAPPQPGSAVIALAGGRDDKHKQVPKFAGPVAFTEVNYTSQFDKARLQAWAASSDQGSFKWTSKSDIRGGFVALIEVASPGPDLDWAVGGAAEGGTDAFSATRIAAVAHEKPGTASIFLAAARHNTGKLTLANTSKIVDLSFYDPAFDSEAPGMTYRAFAHAGTAETAHVIHFEHEDGARLSALSLTLMPCVAATPEDVGPVEVEEVEVPATNAGE